MASRPVVGARSRILLGLACASVMSVVLGGHEVIVHQRVTDDAIDYLIAKGLHPEFEDSICPALKPRLRTGVADEDSFYPARFPTGRFFFHFLPVLSDTPIVGYSDGPLRAAVNADCDSVTWGHAPSATCTGNFDGYALTMSSGPRKNEFNYGTMVNALRNYSPGSLEHNIALEGLGHYLHLLQDLTSPAHTRNDAHPPQNPSVFEKGNADTPITAVDAVLKRLGLTGPLVPMTDRESVFRDLAKRTASRFWSEKNMLLNASGPQGVRTDALGYVYDAENRLIAREIPESVPKRFGVDDKVAKAQFQELAPEAVLYTASMIDYITRTENVKLCAPPLGERYRAVMIPPPYPDWLADWWPTSINARGHVALLYGGLECCFNAGFLWNGTAVSPIQPNGGHLTSIRLNDADQVAVTIRRSDTISRALVWTRDFWPSIFSTDFMTDIGTLGGPTATAIDFNNSGVVLGASALSTGEARGFRWKEAFQAFKLGPPGAKDFLGAMNDLGHVCGGYWIEHPYPTPPDGYAVIWNGTELYPLPRPGADGQPFVCTDLNDNGTAVGWVNNASSGTLAYLWSGSALTDLRDLGGGYASARAINDHGVVVGSSTVIVPPPLERQSHGFVWKDGRMRDLNAMVEGLEAGWTLTVATDINNAGQIVAIVFKQFSGYRSYRAVRLDPM
jgi:probable HAF family extracellular repeat protein